MINSEDSSSSGVEKRQDGCELDFGVDMHVLQGVNASDAIARAERNNREVCFMVY